MMIMIMSVMMLMILTMINIYGVNMIVMLKIVISDHMIMLSII